MTGKTHMSLGLLSAAPLFTIDNKERAVLVCGFALIGSLMPDIDHHNSKISKTVRGIVGSIAALIIMLTYTHVITLKDLIPLANKVNVYSHVTAGCIFIIACLIFSKFTPHRSFTHSIIGAALFGYGVYLITPIYYIAFVIGYISHLAADLITTNGIALFYPFVKKNGKHKHYSLHLMSTNSIWENMIFLISTVLFVYLKIPFVLTYLDKIT